MSGDHNQYQKPQPPKQEWQDLGHEELNEMIKWYSNQLGYIANPRAFYRAISNKLQEKNHGTRQYKDLCGND